MKAVHLFNESDRWKSLEVHQRDKDGYFITEGKYFSTKAKTFQIEQDFNTNYLFPLDGSTDITRAKLLAYGLLFPFYKIGTSLSNTALLAKESILTKKMVNHINLTQQRLKIFGKDALVLITLLAFGYFKPVCFDICNSNYDLVATAVCCYVFYAFFATYQPREMRTRITQVKEFFYDNSTQVSSFSLSQMLGLDPLGKLDEKITVDNLNRFEILKTEKKQ